MKPYSKYLSVLSKTVNFSIFEPIIKDVLEAAECYLRQSRTRSEAGRRSRDTLASLKKPCRKRGLSL